MKLRREEYRKNNRMEEGRGKKTGEDRKRIKKIG